MAVAMMALMSSCGPPMIKVAISGLFRCAQRLELKAKRKNLLMEHLFIAKTHSDHAQALSVTVMF